MAPRGQRDHDQRSRPAVSWKRLENEPVWIGQIPRAWAANRVCQTDTGAVSFLQPSGHLIRGRKAETRRLGADRLGGDRLGGDKLVTRQRLST